MRVHVYSRFQHLCFIVGFNAYALLRHEAVGVLPVVRSSLQADPVKSSQQQPEIQKVTLVSAEHSSDTYPRNPSMPKEVSFSFFLSLSLALSLSDYK